MKSSEVIIPNYNPNNTPTNSKERALERKYWSAIDRRNRLEAKEIKAQVFQKKKDCKRELAVLNYMLKSDVQYFHHGYSESLKKEIEKQIDIIKEKGEWQVYHPYIWNWNEDQSNYMSRCHLGRLFCDSEEFPTIYDVPLDGTYIFYVTDSGQRGSGSFDYLQVRKVEQEAIVTKVNPGAFIGF